LGSYNSLLYFAGEGLNLVKKILIVEDNDEIREMIRLYLSKEEFQIVETAYGHTALELVKLEDPDLILLDILLPGADGIEVCMEIRKFSTVPIIFLSNKAEEVDKIIGLTIGADDYLTKPFSPRELIARIRSLIRRQGFVNLSSKGENDYLLEFNDLKIHLLNFTVEVKGQSIELSSKEFKLLAFLANHPGQVFNSEQLFGAIWGEPSLENTRTVLVHISSLRKKIEDNPSNPTYIHTVRGIGYKFNAE